MNKKVTFILALTFIALMILGTISAVDSSASDDAKTANHNQTFTVGFSSKFPPFGFTLNNGQYAGFDLDLAKEVAKRNNWTFEAQPIISWDSKDAELNSNAVDCIWSEFTIDGRENEYAWSNPYFNNSQVIVVKSNPDINSTDDLKGKTVEVLTSSKSLDAVNENKTLKETFGDVYEISDYETGFMDLNSGACDALIVDIGCAKYHIAEKYSNETFKILNQPLKNEKYGVAFKKGNEELRNQVQKTLDEMFEDGTVDRIAQNYSDYGIPERLIYP